MFINQRQGGLIYGKILCSNYVAKLDLLLS